MPDGQIPLRKSFFVAAVAVALATAARVAFDRPLGEGLPLVTYYVVLALIGLLGDRNATIAFTLLSTPVATYAFVPPRYSLIVADSTDLLRLAAFIATGLVVALLADRLNQTRQRLRRAAAFETQQATEMQAERKRLRELFESIPGVVWEAWGHPDSANQRINYVSDYVEPMLGYKADEWTSQPNFWLQIVHPDDRERAASVAAEKFAAGQLGENEFRWITKDGRTIWVLARSATIKDERGVPIGMRGVTFDITQRKEVEQRLALLAEISTTGLTTLPFEQLATLIARRTAEVVGEYCIIRMLREGRLEAIAYAHSVPEAEPMVRAMASHSNLLEINSLYADIVREPRTLVENDLSAESFARVDRAGVEEVFEKYRARRGIFTPLVSQGTFVGTLAIGRATSPPFTATDAQFAEAIASRASLAFENARLVEAARQDAEEAQAARTEAEEAGRVKDEFLATLSHELRTPLNAILGWAHMLRDPQLLVDRRQAAIDTILRNAQSQEQLISDILDVQRIMAGKIRLNLRTVDLGNVVRSAAETVQPSADAKAVRLQLLLDLDTPQITGDPDRLQQIVWNLLSNAIKFAPQGGHVQVRLLKASDDCELVVEDDGPGIKREFLPHVFERFRQADSSTTRTHKGLGLGLAIVRSLVEMHGGTITAANTAAPAATGAVFTIRLPREAITAAVAGGLTLDREPMWTGETPSLDGLRVLVVEDDTDSRELLGAILLRCGANVTLTGSVAEAMAAFETRQFDVLVSDIEMPEEDGYTLIRRIRSLTSDRSEIPAAALTAYASPSDRMKVLGAGFNIHVAKPVQPAEIAIVVASLAGRHN
jgi:PAS domain S-box-containing protein